MFGFQFPGCLDFGLLQGFADLVAAAKMTGHARENLCGSVWLPDVIIQTLRQDLMPFTDISRRCHRHDPDLPSAFILTNESCCLNTVQYRHAYIHPNKLWTPFAKLSDSLRAVLRHLHLKACMAEQSLQDHPVLLLIF